MPLVKLDYISQQQAALLWPTFPSHLILCRIYLTVALPMEEKFLSKNFIFGVFLYLFITPLFYSYFLSKVKFWQKLHHGWSCSLWSLHLHPFVLFPTPLLTFYQNLFWDVPQIYQGSSMTAYLKANWSPGWLLRPSENSFKKKYESCVHMAIDFITHDNMNIEKCDQNYSCIL